MEENIEKICDLDPELYRCVSRNIRTREVVITEERIAHIKERHPNDYEQYAAYLADIITHPQYILESDMPHTAFRLKEYIDCGKRFQLILRLSIPSDNPIYKNSVITFLHINERKWRKYLRNKKILYKSE